VFQVDNLKIGENLKEKQQKLSHPVGSQSYQTLISSFFRFSLLSWSVCSIRKYCLWFEMTKLSSEKQKKSSFYKEKSLVGLTPGLSFCLEKAIVKFGTKLSFFITF
jgi:hypothetical protein